MRNSLRSWTLFFFLLIFSGIIAIGGLSLFLVKAMLDKISLVETESKNIRLVHQIQGRSNKLLLAIQQFIIHPDEQYALRAELLLAEIEPQLRAYLEYEQQSPYPEGREEVRLLLALQNTLSEISEIQAQSLEDSLTLEAIRALDLHAATLESLVNQINQQHFQIITRKIDKAHGRMLRVLSLYLFFSGIGLLFFFLIYRLSSRHVVQPLGTLAEATTQLAAGDLSVRVPSRSRTEIGRLCGAFNTLAEKLEKSEGELLLFHQELEEKVRERTQALEEAQDRLLRLERLATLGQVATSVNHEIKTPLNALSMNLQLLAKEVQRLCHGCGTESAGLEETIRVIGGEVEGISMILDEFVRYARFAPMTKQETDLNAVITRVVAMLGEKAEKAGVRLTLLLAPGLPRIFLDENKMIQALLNLCSNAFAAMPAGGIITMGSRDAGDAVVCTVSDTGTGIGEADLARIFQPFFSTRATGLGFGLPIVQKIVEDHEGRIICRSAAGQGTTFEIRLPKNTDDGGSSAIDADRGEGNFENLPGEPLAAA
jgi:signal transduction histidine kinase